MVELFATPSGTAISIDSKPSRLYLRDGMFDSSVEGFKLIPLTGCGMNQFNPLIDFIIFLIILQLDRPQNDRIALSLRPLPFSLPIISIPSRPLVFGWLLCFFTSFCGHLRP